MIEKEITFTLDVNKKEFMMLVASPINLPKFWKYLKEIKIINQEEYIAKFKVFMNFNFKMKRTIFPSQVIHEGYMDFPKAMFRFIVEVLETKKGIVVSVKGQYQGPLEFLAPSPMKSFLENFRDKIEEYYKKKEEVFTSQELFKKLTEDSRGKEIVAVIDFNENLYTLTFNNGKLEKVEEEDPTSFLTKLLTYSGFIKLIREEEAFEEEFADMTDVMEKLVQDSLGKEITAKIEAKDRVYLIKLKDGKIIYNEIDPSYKGEVRLLEVSEQ